MNCLFRLDHYLIESVTVAPATRVSNASMTAHTGGYFCLPSTLHPIKRTARKYRLTLEIQVKPTPKNERAFFPYLIAIKGHASFTFKGSMSPPLNPKTPCAAETALAILLWSSCAPRSPRSQPLSVHGLFLPCPALEFR